MTNRNGICSTPKFLGGCAQREIQDTDDSWQKTLFCKPSQGKRQTFLNGIIKIVKCVNFSTEKEPQWFLKLECLNTCGTVGKPVT